VTFFYWARFGFLLLLVGAVAVLLLWGRKGDATRC
jgi:hypothetical protein